MLLGALSETAMYGRPQHMSMHSQIAGDEDDGAASDSIDNPHVHYDGQVLQDGVVPGMEAASDAHSDAVYGADGSEIALQPSDAINQLTLSFRGQVYVFDSVTHEKVCLSVFSCLNFPDLGFTWWFDCRKNVANGTKLKILDIVFLSYLRTKKTQFLIART